MIDRIRKYVLGSKNLPKGDGSAISFSFSGSKPNKNKTAFLFSKNALNPFLVAKISRNTAFNGVDEEFEKVLHLQAALPKGLAKLLPVPLDLTYISGIEVAFYRPIVGSTSALFLGFPASGRMGEKDKRFVESALRTLLDIQLAFNKESDSRGVLYHGDFIPSNIFCNEGGVTQIIDWENSRESQLPLQDFLFFSINICEKAIGCDLEERDFKRSGWVSDYEKFAKPILNEHAKIFGVGQERVASIMDDLLSEIIIREDDGLGRDISRRYEGYLDLLRSGGFFNRLLWGDKH